jgi:hypothetical protein
MAIAEAENPIAEEARKEFEAEKVVDEKPLDEKIVEKPDETVVDDKKVNIEKEVKEEKPNEEVADDKTEVKPEIKEELKPDEEKAINDWALKNSMTVEEAKEDLAKTKAIIEKYKSPEEIAKALRSTQSAYDKLRVEASKEKAAEPFRPSANPKLEVMTFVDSNKDKLVENYRKTYPAKTRDMEDDAILEEISDKLLGEFNNWQHAQIKVVQSEASTKREQLLSSLSESDRKFLPDIKAVVDKTADHTLLSKSFNLNDIVRWAKGSRYDADVKAAEERGFKRATESAKIVAIVPGGSGSGTKVKSNTGATNLSNYDKQRAKEMFGTTNMSEEDMYKEYSDLQKAKNKKK